MARPKKLISLLTVRDADERDALFERTKVERVVEQRRNLVVALEHKKTSLVSEIEQLTKNDKLLAVQLGRVDTLCSVAKYLKRQQKKLRDIDKKLIELRNDLSMAEKRLSLAEDDFMTARVERRKVEHLIESKRQNERVIEEAKEELLIDHLAGLKHKRKD